MEKLINELIKIKIPNSQEAVCQAENEGVIFPDIEMITDEFLKLSYCYKHIFGKYLILQTGLDKVDNFLDEKGFIPYDNDTMDFYQNHDSMNLKHFYIRGIARIDRLSEEENQTFKEIINSDSDNAWFDGFDFVSKTLSKVMVVSTEYPTTVFEPSMTLFRTFKIKGNEIPLALKTTKIENTTDESSTDDTVMMLVNSLDYALSNDLGCSVKVSFMIY